MSVPARDQVDDLNTRLHAIRAACFNCQILANRLELLTVGANCASAEEHLTSAIVIVEKILLPS